MNTSLIFFFSLALWRNPQHQNLQLARGEILYTISIAQYDNLPKKSLKSHSG